MSEAKPVTVTIDGKVYPLAWGNRARIRFGGISSADRSAEGLMPLVTLLWSAIAVKPHPFATWDDLADLINPDDHEANKALDDAVMQVLPKNETPEKKSTSETGPSPDLSST